MVQRVIAVLLALLLIAACGGDGDQAGESNGESEGAWWPARDAEVTTGDDADESGDDESDTTTTTSTTSTTTPAPAEVGEVTIRGESLPFSGPDGEAVGMAAPTVVGEGFGGETIAVGPYERPTIVLFITHWCQFCQEAVTELGPWWDSGAAPSDVDFVAVSTSIDVARENYPASAWLEREGWGIPTLRDDAESSVGTAFGLTGYPFWVAVAADGTVVDQVAGSIGVTEVEALVDRARNG